MAENGFTNLGEEFENKQQNTNETVTEPEVEGIIFLFSFSLFLDNAPKAAIHTDENGITCLFLFPL